ncbi:hypothetical protein AALA99_12490 [Anaerotruncus colihominis]|uniref:hypothetical protein n=1 Tax=Anaerotruncus colihominis TaxID=169435 RepID=UPI0013642716|nr:hypothetical protein [Anaerotruncus colihominis]
MDQSGTEQWMRGLDRLRASLPGAFEALNQELDACGDGETWAIRVRANGVNWQHVFGVWNKKLQPHGHVSSIKTQDEM